MLVLLLNVQEMSLTSCGLGHQVLVRDEAKHLLLMQLIQLDLVVAIEAHLQVVGSVALAEVNASESHVILQLLLHLFEVNELVVLL